MGSNDVRLNFEVLETTEGALTLTDIVSGKVHVLKKYAIGISQKDVNSDMALCYGLIFALMTIENPVFTDSFQKIQSQIVAPLLN